ncbi:MAG: magnesium transporter [Acidimicrobiales bacterium]|nr:magnesium transporter [Hyphomonadaceae bacterium]RZV44957.1 MAG: magnesium transporter [Acidimicrobiales bacterium]
MTDKLDQTHPDTDTPTGKTDLELQNLVELRDAIAQKDSGQVFNLLEGEHPADIADKFEQLSTEERQATIELSPEVLSPAVLAELEDEVVEDVLPRLPAKQISDAVQELDSDDAIQLFEELDDQQRAEVLAVLPDRDREDLEAGFSFDDETAGRLMQREFVAAPEFWTVGQTIDHMRAQGEKDSDALPDLFFDVYVIDTRFHPIGYLPLSALMRHNRNTPLKDIMKDLPVLVEPDTDQEDVAYLFGKYDLISAPVIDADGRLTGMITVDDMVEVIHEENTEDLLALAGVSDAGLTDTSVTIVKARAPWLLVNLMTAIGASIVISLFKDEISKLVALAVLMPIVASLGGNTGTQALAVAIRALATRDLTAANAWRVIKREAIAALMNGVIFAVLLAGITYIWFQNAELSLVIAAALIFNLFCAGLAGILVPLGLKKAGADPAVASSVFVTTVTDVVGFFAFLGLASLFLM